MTENEKVFERIKELVTAYNGEKDFLVSAAAEIGIDPFREGIWDKIYGEEKCTTE